MNAKADEIAPGIDRGDWRERIAFVPPPSTEAAAQSAASVLLLINLPLPRHG